MIPDLIQSKGSIVIVSSDAHYVFVKDTVDTFQFKDKTKIHFKDQSIFSILKQYGFSKLLNILHARYLHHILNEKGVKVNSLHPGAISTNIAPNASFPLAQIVHLFGYLFFKTTFQGCQNTIHVATKKDNASGNYYDQLTPTKPSDIALNDNIAKDLWEWSENEISKYEQIKKI